MDGDNIEVEWCAAAGVLIDSVTVSTAGMYSGWDVRSFVVGEVAGDKLVSVMLKDYSAQDKRIDFERREDGQGAVLEIFTDTPTGILAETQGVPREFALHQNYPNLFNPSTEITFDVPRQEYVKIKVNDMIGKKIAILQDGLLNAGHYN